jgi:alpha-1,2-mannosyltransferase
MTAWASRSSRRERSVAGAAGLALLAVLAVLAFADAARVTPMDFHVYLDAADKVLDGESPYPSLDTWDEVKGRAYVYPPLVAYAVAPFALVPTAVADVLLKLLLVAGVVATIFALGVRDWRCYLVAFAWSPVISAVGNGQLTIPLALAAAVVWRHRANAVAVGVTLGVSVAAKLLVWPLWVWLVVSKRGRAAAIALATGLLLVALPWAAIGFAGVGDYPDLLRRERDFAQSHSYSPFAVAEDLGAGQALAWALALAFAAVLLVAAIVDTARGNDRRGYILAIGAALAFTPVVWLHYYALLLVPVAIVRPRLSPLWFVPLAMWLVVPAIGSDTPYKTAGVVLLGYLTIVLAARAASSGSAAVRAMRPAAARP